MLELEALKIDKCQFQIRCNLCGSPPFSSPIKPSCVSWKLIHHLISAKAFTGFAEEEEEERLNLLVTIENRKQNARWVLSTDSLSCCPCQGN